MRAAALLALLAIAGCTAPPPRVAVTPPPQLVVPPPPGPPTAMDWRDWPVAPGVWRYGRDARGSVAMYGRVDTDAVAVLRCDSRLGRLFLSVAGNAAGTMVVRTSSIVRSIPIGATGGTPAYVAATLTPTDPLLDAMAFSRGRFALTVIGGSPLVVPAWGEVGRVIEDCRS